MDNRKWISTVKEKDKGVGAKKAALSKRKASNAGKNRIRVDYTMEGFWQLKSKLEQKEVYSFDLPGGGCLSKVGAPMLISEGMFVELPPNAEFSGIKILDCDELALEGKYNVLPVPEPVLETEKTNYVKDQSIYNKDEVYPKTAVEYVETINVCGTRCAHILVCPMKYHPKSGKLTVIRKLTFEVLYHTNSKKRDNSISDDIDSAGKSLRGTVLSKHILRSAPPLKGTANPRNFKKRMLIVSVPEFKCALDSYIEFRRDDFIVDTVMCDDIYYRYERDRKDEAIKKYIWAEHEKSPLSYVLLAGDIKHVPTYQLEFESEPKKYEEYLSDSFYSVRGKELLPQFGISRLPAETHDELLGMIRQAARYTTLDERKSRKAVLIAWNNENFEGFENCSDSIYEQHHESFQMLKCYDGKCSKGELIKIINKGQTFINYRGHGSSIGSWGKYIGLKTDDVNKRLKDTDCYPHVFGICSNNNDMNSKDCFGAAWLKKSRAITFLGATAPSYRSVNNSFDKYLWEAVNFQGLTEISDIYTWATYALYKNSFKNKYMEKNIREYLLLGDPAADFAEQKKLIPDVYYRVRVGGKWGPEVKNLEGYAGTPGRAITDIAIRFSKGKCKYRVHVLKEHEWLPWVTGYNIKARKNGYAGKRRAIDAIQIYYQTPPELVKLLGHHLVAEYRIGHIKENYEDYQHNLETTDGQIGYAGNFRRYIDRIQITLADFDC